MNKLEKVQLAKDLSAIYQSSKVDAITKKRISELILQDDKKVLINVIENEIEPLSHFAEKKKKEILKRLEELKWQN